MQTKLDKLFEQNIGLMKSLNDKAYDLAFKIVTALKNGAPNECKSLEDTLTDVNAKIEELIASIEGKNGE